MSGRIDLKSVRLKTAQKYSNWLLFYLFFPKTGTFFSALRMKDGDKDYKSMLPCYYVEKTDEVKECA